MRGLEMKVLFYSRRVVQSTLYSCDRSIALDLATRSLKSAA